MDTNDFEPEWLNILQAHKCKLGRPSITHIATKPQRTLNYAVMLRHNAEQSAVPCNTEILQVYCAHKHTTICYCLPSLTSPVLQPYIHPNIYCFSNYQI